MARQSKSQKDTIERVMHEFKEGELTQKGGRHIKDRKQAVAVALSEAGASRKPAAAETKNRRRKTASGPARNTSKTKTADGKTRATLYREATRRGIVGRSRMTKQELERALAR